MAKDEPAKNKDAVPPGSVSQAEGLAAWKRIEAVVTPSALCQLPCRRQNYPDLDTGRRKAKPRPHSA